MNIYLNEKSTEINSKNKEEIIENITAELEDEIIEKIYLDEVEVSLNYFLHNDLELDRFNKIKFISKKIDLLIEETLNQSEKYLPKLKTGIKEVAEELNNYQNASELINSIIDGLEWYLNILNSIIDLKEGETIDVEKLLKKFNMALNRAMISLNQEEYNDFADLLEVEIIEYLDKLQSYHQDLLEEN